MIQQKSKNKELAKAASLAVVDSVVVGIDTSLGGTPLTTGAWALSKVLLGSGLALRQKKALEWVEMVRDNPEVFTKSLLKASEFQDAFVSSLEGYLKERNSDKRNILRAIFINFSAFPYPAKYPLERFNEITKQLSITDAKNFSYIVYLSTEYKPGASIGEGTSDIESILHLCALGLLIQDTSPRYMTEGIIGPPHPFVFVSATGSRYYDFIKTSNILESSK